MTINCKRCRRNVSVTHFNSIYCLPCRAARRAKPRTNLDDDQQREALSYIGKLSRPQMAEKMGVSIASLARLFREKGVVTRIPTYSEQLKSAVLEYFEEHGQVGIDKAFPDVRYRSIVERFERAPRTTRWKPADVVVLARMAGLVPQSLQAEIFARPRAHAGSIKAFWTKRMTSVGSTLHGMRRDQAKRILRPGFPHVQVAYSATQRLPRTQIALWCDMPGWVRHDMPPFIHDAIDAMRQFQCWLFGTDNPRDAILSIARQGFELRHHRRSSPQ